MKLLLSLLFAALTASAGEYVVLTNGFRIHADSHVTEGSTVRLTTSQGVIELQVSTVSAFETEEYTPPPVPVQAVPVPGKATEAVVDLRLLTPQEMITRAAERAGLPPEFVHSIARAESGYRPDALSPKGAIGLMQLMPGTA